MSSPSGVLRLGGAEFGPGQYAVMAVLNRTPDSFYDKGATFAFDAALAAADAAVAAGADIVDVGGVKAGYGEHVSTEEEIRRTVPFVAELRRRHPGLVISVDTWRARVGRECAEAGADLINDTWSGADPDLARAAAEYDVGLVCSHSGGLGPRTDPHRVSYADVVADVESTVVGLAERAVSLGVRPDRLLIDPTHDFGKNTYHSLELTRRLGELAATGWPVLVAVSNKDFIGETLDRPVAERGPGTLAALAVSAWLGARVFRVHDTAAARGALDAVAGLAGADGV
ncbi:dihydropteroate synthase [Actinorugispora endophytica]|uniref:Dihydropteroate synthase n=1 Tax=Actinorugispora endophytica TaxID=1605990 RepID=A0A4R6V4W7_9ACTN|nr:dihydropteroate synthase [Actinorugispora endophytica]TDQ53337.1 dihydropteroate synthase [Actinorugispora endophytica]